MNLYVLCFLLQKQAADHHDSDPTLPPTIAQILKPFFPMNDHSPAPPIPVYSWVYLYWCASFSYDVSPQHLEFCTCPLTNCAIFFCYISLQWTIVIQFCCCSLLVQHVRWYKSDPTWWHHWSQPQWCFWQEWCRCKVQAWEHSIPWLSSKLHCVALTSTYWLQYTSSRQH